MYKNSRNCIKCIESRPQRARDQLQLRFYTILYNSSSFYTFFIQFAICLERNACFLVKVQHLTQETHVFQKKLSTYCTKAHKTAKICISLETYCKLYKKCIKTL